MKPETFIDPQGNEVVLIHFVGSDGRLACMPSLAVLSATSGANAQRLTPHLRSGEVGSVTCRVCRKSQTFADADANLRSVLRAKT